MIEQKDCLDELGMPNFMHFFKSCSILWCLAQKNIDHDFRKYMKFVSYFSELKNL